jgi:hypothetical protein
VSVPPKSPTLREQVLTLSEQLTSVSGELSRERDNTEMLGESLSQLELAMEDIGWHRLLANADREFTREGLRQISAVCRLFAIKSPLTKRALVLKQVYVWGDGVEITARANGRRQRKGEQDVNTVLQSFLGDPGNRRTFTGVDSQTRLERSIGTDGNVFLSLWTRPVTGRVQVRVLPYDEIFDIIRNPDDASEPWYYRRRWLETTFDPATGEQPAEQREALYPSIDYRPKSRPARLGGIDVRWDAPVRHVKVNDLDGWRFGIGDAYAAVDWARAYKEFLEDWARLVKALSRFAWRTTAAGSKQAAAIRTKLGAAPLRNPMTGQLDNVGETAVIGQGQTLEAIPKTGAVINSESGKPLAAMVAAAFGVPVTMLLCDPGHSGARAVAKTLDQPTELEMESRRSLWSETIRDVAAYVIRESVRAPKGTLKGKIVRDEDADREYCELAGDTEDTIDVTWSDLKDLAAGDVVAAVVAASTTMTMPPEVTLQQLLVALGLKHADEIVDAMLDSDGKFIWPSVPPVAGAGLGQAAADLANANADPAAAGDGNMADDTPVEPGSGGSQ